MTVAESLRQRLQDQLEPSRLEILDDITYWGRRGAAHPGGEVGLSMRNTMCNPGSVSIPWFAQMQENHPKFGPPVVAWRRHGAIPRKAKYLSIGMMTISFVVVAIASMAWTKTADREANGFSWGPIKEVAILFAGIFICIVPVMAMLNGVEFYVYAWAGSGGNPIPGAAYAHELYWHRCDSTGACTSPTRIPNQLSLGRVNLAAYNGYIYMVHQGDSDSTAVWFSRLDPATGAWTPNVKLPFVTVNGAPALVPFNGLLYVIGSSEITVVRRGIEITTYPLWYATMGANEVFSSTRAVGSESITPPSGAVLGDTLYLAHIYGQTAPIVIQKLTATTSWSAPTYISAGPSSSYIQGEDVQLASVNGYLHLIHHRFSDGLTYWTYNRGCDAWAPELSLDTYSNDWMSSMSTGINGLVVNRVKNENSLPPYYNIRWHMNRFIAPPAPITLPNCGAI